MSERQTKSDCCEPIATALSISFTGPMFFDFGSRRDEKLVDIYVPYCPFHQAAFFFSTGSWSESDIYAKCNCSSKAESRRPREYLISSEGIEGWSGSPEVLVPKGGQRLVTRYPKARQTESARESDSNLYVLSIDGVSAKKSGAELHAPALPATTNKRLFKLTVPKPRYISGLYKDTLRVVPTAQEDPEGDALDHCTSFRFYYEWFRRKPVHLYVPHEGDPLPITPPLYNCIPQLADIEVRYDGIGLEDENDPHSDARSCFASLASLANTEWWLDYGDDLTCPTNTHPRKQSAEDPLPHHPCGVSGGNKVITIKTGSDCHSPVITTGLSLT